MATGAVLQDPFGLTGSVLEGQYRVDAVVGEGGFGVVYRGRHLSLDQPVAIKVLKGLDGGDPRLNAIVLEKFRAEARLLYTLSQASLNIVRAIHFSATNTPSGAWAPFMVLEWLDGRSLADDLADRQRQGLGGRSLQEAMPVLAGVAEGLSVAHRHQVAHRDVKPANVFLLRPDPAHAEPGDGGPRVKVLDFGIAKIMKEGEGAGTKGTLASFTWLYAAPEQLDPRLGPTGLATDVYAFALMITEVLAGKPPIDERDTSGIMMKAMDPNRRPTPRACGANISDEVEAVCTKALAVDPKQRFATVADLWTAFSSAGKVRHATTMQKAIVVPSQTNIAASPLAATNPRPPSNAPPRPSYVHPPSGHAPTNMAPHTGPQPMPPPRTGPQPLPPPWTGPPPMPHTGPQPMAPMPPPPPMQPWGMGPPPGTAPPGGWRRPQFMNDSGMSLATVVMIVLVVLSMFVVGSCVMMGACLSATNGG